MAKVHISAVRSDDKTTETWVLHVYAPAPHHAEWLAYTPVHVGRFDVPSYRGFVTVEAGNLDRAKRHAIAYFKAIERPTPARDGERPMVTGGGLIKFDRRADDASGAEAMREAWAYAIVNAQGKRTGVIHADRSRLVPIVEADNDDDLAGGPFRIVPLAPLPARDDAVEEAASVAAMLAEKRVLTVPTERVARWVAEHLSALRSAKGGTGG